MVCDKFYIFVGRMHMPELQTLQSGTGYYDIT